MKHEKISMKWKVYGFFLIFTLLLLAILWMFQTVYLGVFYKQIKRSELKQAMQNLQSSFDTENFDEALEAVAQSYDISVMITDDTGVILKTSGYIKEGGEQLAREQFETLYQKAKKEGGEYFQEMDKEAPVLEIMDEKTDVNRRSEFQGFPGMPKKNREESVTWVSIVNDGAREHVIIVNSIITPVDATVHTLRIQLLYISVIFVVLSLCIALILSRNISKSIIKVNRAAKELAKANYSVTFDARDYREIAELSDTLNYAAEELAKTEKFQHELIANVSHDLRTPLTMIIAYAEVMRDLPGENTPENVQVVIDESRRLTALVNDMLDISKLQAGVLSLEEKVYNLTASIENVLERFSKLMEQEGYDISFVYNEEIWVSADEYKINQVLYNLVSNAVNYAGEDKKVIVRQILKENMVRIEVQDNGEGISQEVLPYVWERYYKVDKNHRRAVSGTGLGLSIVKNILKLHEAAFGVESKLGSGSLFWFELKVNIL